MGTLTASQWIDVCLAVVILLQAIGGWVRGFVTSVLGVLGYVGGTALAVWAVANLPERLGIQPDPATRTIALLASVVMLALLAHGLMAALGRRMLADRRRSLLGRLDRAAGALLAGTVTVLVVGLLTQALGVALPAAWRPAVEGSRVAQGSVALVPPQLAEQGARLTERLAELPFPQVFGDPTDEPELDVPAPDDAAAQTREVKAAQASVVKVIASAPRCRASAAGSGWVAAPGRVVTNAHVVAGADGFAVVSGGTGATLSATVISFDPFTDVAVLDVPQLHAAALPLAGGLAVGDEAVVAGFPGGGPYRVTPARVGRTLDATGRDIYDAATATREIYSISAAVRQGNSGGPLLTPDGEVAGTVFARSLNSDDTGFVLTNDATAAAIAAARAPAAEPVATGVCLSG